ncbi:2-phospho-L-lactate guanylyltransferase [Solwaraspora sp. WMMB335]|uniref:2-phospho-L-lactate guanylyltransferase n=1 Tax=Solwaraspora sp. WMMB335 TaxID=3404118 RepID=UPI003B951618
MREEAWSVVLPVKPLGRAKSRLRGAVPGVRHEELALALACDTLAAVLACPLVVAAVVVTPDPVAAAALAALGARTVAEPGPDDEPGGDGPDGGGLNAAFAHGAALAAASGASVAALTADLPALRPDDLVAALAAAGRIATGQGGSGAPGRSFVPDAAGTGTVLLAAVRPAALKPRFGAGSAARHAASGARRLPGDWPTLRRDVDTAADLAAAAALGLGRHTAALCPAGVGC